MASSRTARSFVFLAACVGLFFGTASASPFFTVTIDQATMNDSLLSVSGVVTSLDRGNLATGVTIDLLPSGGTPIRMITNLPLLPRQISAPYTWTGATPDGSAILPGSSVKVTTNRQSNATAPLVVDTTLH